jgi:general secretion pathway protein E
MNEHAPRTDEQANAHSAAAAAVRALPRYVSHEFRAVLAEAGELTEADFRLIDELMRQHATTELRAILDLGLISEDALADRLASYMGLARLDTSEEAAELEPAHTVPIGFMRTNAVLVIAGDDADPDAEPQGSAAPAPGPIAVADPSDHHTLAAVLGLFASAVPEVRIATHKQISAVLDAADRAHAGPAGESDERAADLSADLAHLRDMASEAPVIRFFNQAVERAMELGASDIHLERFERSVHMRMRVDGILQDQPPPAAGMYDALLTRIKISAGLDIAERRRAQDGRVRMRLRGRNVDMRVSIVPTMYGQDAAIRIQDRQRLASVSLTELGFTDAQIQSLYATAAKSHGILLITGPTGSGKTTTLYAILRRLVTAERKVMTVEDPVEYAMSGVNQVQVNPAINLTFANTLRHLLRHDPDVILVGEIRDAETAQMAFQASLTGHMVLSTLHTNDVPSSFVRLVDMGVEPYLVNAAVEGVSAQRLLRKINREASERTGERVYKGRVAIMEFSPVTNAVKRCMLAGADEHNIARELLAEGFRPMRTAAERLVEAGITDEAEVARVLGAADPDDAADDRSSGGAIA